MDSLLESSFVENKTTTKITSIKKIEAPDVPIKKVIDEDVLNKRKLRFSENAPPDCKVPVSKKDTSDVLERRQLRFNENELKKPNEDLLNTLKRRKERFGEITSTLLRKIEEKEKVLKRKARFEQINDGIEEIEEKEKVLKRKARFEQINEGIEENYVKVKKSKPDEKLDDDVCELSTSKQTNEKNGKKVLKKISFEDTDSTLSRDTNLNGS